MGITVRPFRPGDEGGIQDLFVKAFGESRSLERWRWRFVDAPAPAELVMLEADGDLAGHVAFNRFATWIDGNVVTAATGGDWMVDPAHRRGGLSAAMMPTLDDFYRTVAFSLDFPSDYTIERIRREGWIGQFLTADLGRIPQWVRWSTGAGVRRSNPRIPVGAASLVAAWFRRAARRARRARATKAIEGVHDLRGEEAGFDAVADRSASFARLIRVRDAEYVRWRWFAQPGRAWNLDILRSPDGELSGWVVYGRPDDGRAGKIVDLLAPDEPIATALVSHAADRLEAEGAEPVTCDLLDPRPWVAAAMKRAGFADRGTGPNLLLSRAAPEHTDAASARGSWYLTLGDSDLA